MFIVIEEVLCMKHDLEQLEDVQLHPASAKAEHKKLQTDAEIDEENL